MWQMMLCRFAEINDLWGFDCNIHINIYIYIYMAFDLFTLNLF